MNAMDRNVAAGRAATPDVDQFRLRRFIDRLANTEELEIRAESVALADVAAALDGNARAVLFRKTGPDSQELVGGVCASRSRLAHAFGVEVDQLAAEVLRRIRNAPEVVELPRAKAPCQDVVSTGKDADLTRLPVHLQHGCDGGPYISSSLDFTIDPRTGLTNVGIRRLMLRGAPVPVVKCITSDIRVPADAEYVLEGYFDAKGYTELEGPYGEFLGYYGAVKRNPVFKLTAITHRRDALFQTSTISGTSLAITDTAVLNAIRTEVIVWGALQIAVREPLGVYVTASSGGSFNVRVKMRQRVPGEARNAIHACFACLANVKNVFVVDPDIDITNDQQMDWAHATRFQPDRDIVIASGTRTLALDPSLNGARIGGKAGYDLTWPIGAMARLEHQVPAPPRYPGRKFPSIEAALTDGPKHFEELMAATSSKDGREIVRALDVLRQAGRLDREDQRGKWVLKG